MSYTREQLCEEVHSLLDCLPKYNSPTNKVPKNGIYFWYEEGELRNGGGLRVTRVGNNETGALHKRIEKHYGRNRNNSSLREDIGAALICKIDEIGKLGGWRNDKISSKCFQDYEEQVDQIIKNGFYSVLKVDDFYERINLEKQLISLFANCRLYHLHCRSSQKWLGNYSDKFVIRASGLWNKEILSINEFGEQNLGKLMQLINDSLYCVIT